MVQTEGGKTHIMFKNKGRAVALIAAAVLAGAAAGGWHWGNNHKAQGHPKAGWAWGDDGAAVVVADDSSLESQ
jgi:hypothetical protein